MNRSVRKIVMLLVGVLFIGSGIGLAFYKYSDLLFSRIGVASASYDGISKYDPVLHKAFIQKQFKENWYLLVEPADFDVEYMLDNKSPGTYYPQYKGKLTIVVLYGKGEPVGFGTYYMLNNVAARIQFIAVDEAFRGNRYAEKLVNYALSDLKKSGARFVRLATRTTNIAAQKVYNRLGFEIVAEDHGFFHYRKDV